MKRLVIGALVGIFTASALIFASPALATNEGQIEGGNIYRVKNITKNIDFTDPVTADACDTVQFRVRIHNPGPGVLTSVTAKATLPSGSAKTHTSTMTVSAINANPQSTSDTATVNVSSSASISYLSGTTQLLDANGNAIQTLGDGIVSGGVNIGNVGVSINEKRFVQFQAKLNCPEVPKPSFKCEALSVTKLSATKYEFTATASVKSATVTGYVFTTKDSSGNVVDTKTVTTNSTSAKYTFEQSKAGTYTVSVVVKTSEGDAAVGICVQTITIATSTTPTTPSTELPNTGPGSVVGMVAGTSAVATALHYGMAMRRARRDEV